MRRVVVATLLLLAAPAILVAQRGSVAGVIVSHETGEPLPYSMVAVPSLAREYFTSDSGAFFLGDLPVGPLVLRVRRLGYTPSEVTIHVRAGAPDKILVQLSRVVVQLAAVTVREYPPCTTPGAPREDDGSPLGTLFAQLRLNAEQYRLLAQSYPFTYSMMSVQSQKSRKTGDIVLYRRELLLIDGKPRWKYRPGNMLQRRGRADFFNVPTLVDVADEAFIREHCFHYGGLEGWNAEDLIRVDVVVADRITDPDVNGSMYLDPKTFQIRRTVFRLSRPSPRIANVIDMQITTEFHEVLPSIPVVANIYSVQTMDPRSKGDVAEAYERQRLVHFEFKGAKPGDVKRVP